MMSPMALWTKARSLDELGLDIYAMEAYVECINMTHSEEYGIQERNMSLRGPYDGFGIKKNLGRGKVS